VALFGEGRITHLPGGIEEYLKRRAGLPTPAGPAAMSSPARSAGRAPAGSAVASPVGSSARAGGAPAQPAEQPSASSGERRDAQKEARRLERRLATLNTREAKLHTALAEAATDPPRLLELDAELRALVAERAEVEEEWLLAAETAEG
jgi:ABC transport system ATP-binding/permease protein